MLSGPQRTPASTLTFDSVDWNHIRSLHVSSHRLCILTAVFPLTLVDWSSLPVCVVQTVLELGEDHSSCSPSPFYSELSVIRTSRVADVVCGRGRSSTTVRVRDANSSSSAMHTSC